MTARQTDIIARIPIGVKNRIKSRDLCLMTEANSSQIRSAVNAARKEGIPIGSDSEGYFVALSPQDLAHSLRHMRSRIREIEMAMVGLEKAAVALMDYDEYEEFEVLKNADKQ